MGNTPYHHGDLRTAMIEKGIEMINEQGINSLSLRKLAVACGVSHAAPYSHFASKEELFNAIQNHIAEQFVIVLSKAIKESNDSFEGLFRMGCAYVMFFVRNPQYYSFIYSRSNICIDFTENNNEYEPFVVYKNFMTGLFDEINYPNERRLNTIITHWAFVHGLASVATMPGSGSVEEWEKRVPDLLANSYFLGGAQC
jgi:AcrR family transcriptional regulator